MSCTATGGQVLEMQARPLGSSVEGDVEAELAAGVEQLRILRVFLHDPDVIVLAAELPVMLVKVLPKSVVLKM